MPRDKISPKTFNPLEILQKNDSAIRLMIVY